MVSVIVTFPQTWDAHAMSFKAWFSFTLDLIQVSAGIISVSAGSKELKTDLNCESIF